MDRQEWYNDPFDIEEIIPGRKIKSVNGKIKWHIENFTADMDKYKVILAFTSVFAKWQPYFNDTFESTSKPHEAQIILHFRHNGEAGLPKPFRQGVLAYAYAPWNGKSNIWVNDGYNWGEAHAGGKISLFKVLVHEVGHSFNLAHSTDIKDIMYPRYQPNNEVNITQDTIDAIYKLYGEKKEPTPDVPDDSPSVPTPTPAPDPTPDPTPTPSPAPKPCDPCPKIDKDFRKVVLAKIRELENFIKELKKLL